MLDIYKPAKPRYKPDLQLNAALLNLQALNVVFSFCPRPDAIWLVCLLPSVLSNSWVARLRASLHNIPLNFHATPVGSRDLETTEEWLQILIPLFSCVADGISR